MPGLPVFLSYPPTDMIIHGVDRDVRLTLNINVWVYLVDGRDWTGSGLWPRLCLQNHSRLLPGTHGRCGGTVAALGATGGFTLPVMFGLVVDLLGIHSACFMLLYGTYPSAWA